MQAFTRTQREIGGVVFVADDTIFTMRNIALHALRKTLVVFSSKFIWVPKSPGLSSTLTDFQGLSRPWKGAVKIHWLSLTLKDRMNPVDTLSMKLVCGYRLLIVTHEACVDPRASLALATEPACDVTHVVFFSRSILRCARKFEIRCLLILQQRSRPHSVSDYIIPVTF